MLSLIVFILIGNYLLERYLDWLNMRNWTNELPDELKGIYDEHKYHKSQEYEKAKTQFGFVSSTFSLIVMLTLLFTGSFALLNNAVLTITTHPVWSALLFFAMLAVLSDLLNLPFSYYSTFVLEDKFGFNRTNLATFALDKLKGYAIGIILGGGFLYLFVWFYNTTGTNFWLYAWASITIIMLLITMFYASLIVPMFNKLTPLPDNELRQDIENYCSKVGFKLNNLFVMDGSKRSAKANAFFSGIGARKRIVLYDTLLNNHTNDELVAVLAHEIGHYKKKHTRLTFTLGILQTGLMLFIFSRLVSNPDLSTALGSNKPFLQLGMLAFGILYSPLSLIIGLLMNVVSRKNEFEADRYAKETFNGQALTSALKKLSVNNLSNLMPHPVYVFFHYSHPPLLQRLKSLKS